MALVGEVVCALGGHVGEVFGGTDKDTFASWSFEYKPQRPNACQLGLLPRSPQDKANNNSNNWCALLAEGERDVINDLVRVGFHYREVSRFICVESRPQPLNHRHRHKEEETVSGSGRAYRRAFACGLSEVLEGYREDVVQAERRLSDGYGTLPLAELQGRFCEHDLLVSRLHSLVCSVHDEDLGGGALLRRAEELEVCGVPCVERAASVLADSMREVMYRQLGAWLGYGRLVGGEGEFFICRSARHSEEGGDDLDEVSTAEWHGGFEVDDSRLPLGVSREAAEAVLFVGKSQRILRRFRDRGARSGSAPLAGTGRGESPKSIGSEALALLDPLRSRRGFHKPDFDSCVFELRAKAAERMWQLVVVHAELPRHLQALKDYFLMERGNFHQALLTELRPLMRSTPNPKTAELEVGDALSRAATLTGLEKDPLLGRVTSRFGGASPGDQGLSLPSCDDWDALWLDYRVQWPLGLVLTPRILGRYRDAFRFLWRLRRTTGELDEVWTTLRRISSRSHAHSRLCDSPQVWHLRHQLYHLLCNYQTYVQADVIEAQQRKLSDKVGQAENFLDLENALDAFTSSLISQSFLDVTSITSMLDGVIKLCFKFANAVHAQLDSNSPLESLPLFSRLQDDFQRRQGMLFAVLKGSKLSASARAPHLHQFLQRLDYNGWCGRVALEGQLRHG